MKMVISHKRPTSLRLVVMVMAAGLVLAGCDSRGGAEKPPERTGVEGGAAAPNRLGINGR